MTKEPAAAEVDFKELTEHILNSYLNSCSEEDMAVLKLLDESMSVIGTGKQEFFRNLQEFSKSFLFEVNSARKFDSGGRILRSMNKKSMRSTCWSTVQC